MRGSLRKAGSREAQPCCESEEFLKGKIEAYDQTGRMTNASFDNNNNKKNGDEERCSISWRERLVRYWGGCLKGSVRLAGSFFWGAGYNFKTSLFFFLFALITIFMLRDL